MRVSATPIEALLGGVSLGLLSVGRLFIHGKIFGISGNVRGFLKNPSDKSRAAVVTGLVAGGAGLAVLAPGCFGVLPSTFSVARATVAGLLVGAGASLANGCTSGHGICGNARLSPRSLFFTIIIMVSGVISAKLSGAAEALGVHPIGFPPLTSPSPQTLLTGAALVAAVTATLSAFASLVKRPTTAATRNKTENTTEAVQGSQNVELAADCVEGFLFSLAIGFAGMTDPRKVVAFLNVTSEGFDYSLAFVMGGAILTAIGPFLSDSRRRGLRNSISGIDRKLALGGVLFGAGWGAAGLCPGPAVSALTTMTKQVLAFNAAALSAMYFVP